MLNKPHKSSKASKASKASKPIKKVKIFLPIPASDPIPEVAFEPLVTTPPEPPIPLEETLGPVKCLLVVKETFWAGTEYIVIAAAPGHVLPAGLKTGQEVDVKFYPPNKADADASAPNFN